MIKIIVSNKVYLKPPEELIKILERNYVFEIYEHHSQKYPKIVRQINRISEEVYCIERGSLEFIVEWLTNNGYEFTIVDRTVECPVNINTMILPPREDQIPIIEAYSKDSIINAIPGFGKTATAIGIISKLQQRTLIVCTTTAIRDNWVSEIDKFLDMKAGVLGSGKIHSDASIVVGNFQTVCKLSNQISKEFGLIIIDEMHHTPAASFTSILNSSHAKYRLGLSGTLKRKDGLHVVFPGLFGTTIYQPAANNVMKPTIVRVPCDIELSGNPQVPWANKINDIYNNKTYTLFIAFLVQKLEAQGHKILVTGDRVEFLSELTDCYSDARLFIGEVSTDTRNAYLKDILCDKANKIFASTSLFSEGISCNPLSALIHTSSTNNESLVYQLVGRIQRIVEGKPNPVVIDICFEGALGKKHAKERKALYQVKGWDVIDVELHDLDSVLNILLQET